MFFVPMIILSFEQKVASVASMLLFSDPFSLLSLGLRYA